METTRHNTGNHGFHNSNTAIAGSLLRRLAMLVPVFAMLIAAPAQVPPPHGASALQDWRTAWRAIS